MRALLGGVALLTVGCGLFRDIRRPCVYEVPETFRGWVLIQHSKATCPPLEVQDEEWAFRIPMSGYLCTSTAPEFGWAKDEYCFVGAERAPIQQTGWGGGGLIWAGSNGSCQLAGQPEAVTAHFFVGTEEEFKKAPQQPLPPDCLRE